MKKKLKVIVNGKPYLVEIEDNGGADTAVTVNGVAYSVNLEAADGPEVPAVPAATTPPALAEKTHTTARSVTAGSGVLAAPMPGVILDIAVKAGDAVKRGDLLCALEAMKMKNAIRAPREAVIASVEVQDGQKVAYGDVLIKFA